MDNSIHGHEILRLIHESDPPLTRQEFNRVVADKLGNDARFHTCSGSDMNLDQLLEFLAERGKVFEVDGTLRTDIRLMCDDDE